MHVVGFIIRIYHDTRSSECQIPKWQSWIYCRSLLRLVFLIVTSFIKPKLWWICMWHTLLATVLVTGCILCSWYLSLDTLRGISSSDLCIHWWSRTWHVMSIHRGNERGVRANYATRSPYFCAPKQLTPWWQVPNLEMRHLRCVVSITKDFVYYTYSQAQLYLRIST